MTSPIDTRISLPLPGPHSSGRTAPASISGPAFSETLRSAVQEVSRLQDDATAAMEQLHAGQTDDVTRVLVRQCVRSGTSVGANYIEANEALSKKDFLMRIKVCRKEAKESRLFRRHPRSRTSWRKNQPASRPDRSSAYSTAR